MPVKPTANEINAYKNMRDNPHFGKDMLEAIINGTPELKDALLSAGLVEEVKNG